MDVRALFLGLLQGATEFLPISSSGHLVLVPWLLGWPIPSLAFDTLVHWGTAVAVIGYFWRDWVALIRGAWRGFRTRSLNDPETRLLCLILFATVPGALAGALLEDFFEGMFARPAAAAGFLLFTAAILILAEFTWARHSSNPDSDAPRALTDLSWTDALMIGLAQAVAILPGVSRSGATIAAGLGRRLEREAAARFSFLLSTPIILGAGAMQMLQLFRSGGWAGEAATLMVGFLAALVSGGLSIHFLLRYVRRRPLYLFALYCVLMGILGLIVAILRG
ncbi:MAG: undecaprenyl-diphosphate phosphatase [Anaerolineae bacterium]|nr:undecaprenyl-diphosphate phosphatase [Anaerolineae bacterium]MDW8068540.1 undecaprenyl-diphosphate phosphatase [Anaerolineae bacterium]